jgi:hypothetical protein
VTEDARRRLLELLGTIGSYNDKGISWTGAAPAAVAEMRAGFRRALDAFIADVGADDLPAPLLDYLRSPRAVEDGDGGTGVISLKKPSQCARLSGASARKFGIITSSS